MERGDLIAKILLHCSLTVCSFHALEHYADILFLQLIHTDKRQAACHTVFLQQLILQFTAHRHDLLKQFFNPVTVEVVVCHIFCLFNDFFFTFLIKHLFAGADLVLCHFSADLHTLLKKLRHLTVNGVYLIS